MTKTILSLVAVLTFSAPLAAEQQDRELKRLQVTQTTSAGAIFDDSYWGGMPTPEGYLRTWTDENGAMSYMEMKIRAKHGGCGYDVNIEGTVSGFVPNGSMYNVEDVNKGGNVSIIFLRRNPDYAPDGSLHYDPSTIIQFAVDLGECGTTIYNADFRS